MAIREYTLEDYKEELSHWVVVRVAHGDDGHVIRWLNDHVGQGCFYSSRPDLMHIPPEDCQWYMDWSVVEEMFELVVLFRQFHSLLLFKLTWGGR